VNPKTRDSEPDAMSTTPKRTRRYARRALASVSLLAAAGVAVVSCVALPPSRASLDGVSRLDAIDRPWPGLESPVRVTWDDRLVPSINAESDADAAYAVGLVHAHLRLAQMELLRRVSQGRLAEMAGPLAAGVDKGIRALDLGRAVPEIEKNLPDDTRAWIVRYTAGVNEYRESLAGRPADAVTLGFSYDEPWTVSDVLTIGRLAGVDVHWGRWLGVLALRDQAGYDDFVARLWNFADSGLPSFGPEAPTDLSTLTDLGKTGSNAVVVSKEKSATGSALVATDPHLGIPVPNLWCAVGYRTPERAAVGLTIPGLPFILVGRNEQIAWTGTNMQASSSVLYQLEDGWTPERTRTEKIAVRFWLDETVEIRESGHGPVLTDAPLLERLGDGDIAMTWRGHFPSDEPTAFFRASSAQNWNQFREAFRPYAVSGQNMLYADAEGNIGQVMAIEAVPAAAAASRRGAVSPENPDFQWRGGVPSPELPAAFNPEAGFLVSANNVPARFTQPLVPQGNANDRVQRMTELLEPSDAVTLDDLARLQLDTRSIAALRTARAISAALEGAQLSDRARMMLDELDDWNGDHNAGTVGAAAYQRVLDQLIDALYDGRYGEGIQNSIRSAPYASDFVREDLQSADPLTVADAVNAAASEWTPGVAWGDIHRLRVAHPVGAVPLLGRWYTFGDHPYAGSTTTIFKAAHGVTPERHTTRFGANARLLMDMSDPDSNRLVLLGGQDGWLGSDRLLDQLPAWLEGRAFPLPLTPEAQQRIAKRTTTLAPAAKR